MKNKRLENLLFNAIVLLLNENFTRKQIMDELGMTEKEFESIVDCKENPESPCKIRNTIYYIEDSEGEGNPEFTIKEAAVKSVAIKKGNTFIICDESGFFAEALRKKMENKTN